MDAHRRSEDHIESLLEGIKEAQSKGMEQLSNQIASVQSEVKALVSRSNDIAMENVRQITRLEGQVASANAAVVRVETEAKAKLDAQLAAVNASLTRVEAEAKARDDKMGQRVDPIERQFWKTTGMAVVVSGAIGVALEAADLFGRHAK